MQTRKSILIEEIAEKLTMISCYVPLLNKTGKTDFNRDLEDFFIYLLNECYSLNLIDLNVIQYNYPAIDLGDLDSRICIQVTSDSAKSKYKSTLEKFKKHNLQNQYDHLWFLLISNKPKEELNKNIGLKTKVINTSDLIDVISKLDIKKIDELNVYLQENLVIRSSSKKQSILPSDRYKCVNNIDKLIDYLDLSDQPKLQNELFSEISNLNQIFASLELNQKEYLYYVIQNSSFNNNCTLSMFIPSSELLQKFNSYGYEIFQTLEFKGLLYADDDYDFNGRSIIAVIPSKYNTLLDQNLFGILKAYCHDKNLNLRKIFINNDFSDL